MSKNTKDVVEDKDYSLERVPVTARKGFWPMFFISKYECWCKTGNRIEPAGIYMGGSDWKYCSGGLYRGAWLYRKPHRYVTGPTCPAFFR